MKIVNIVGYALFLVVILLGYWLYASIKAPLDEMKRIQAGEALVIKKLELIRDLQVAYNSVHEKYAPTFEELSRFVKEDTFLIKERIEKVVGANDSVQIEVRVLGKIAAKDSLFKKFPDLDLDNLATVPVSGAKFEIFAGRIAVGRSTANLEVPVFEVKDPAPIDPERVTGRKNKKPLQVGSRFEATTSGNWR
jgi:hypothetical protein